jgi:hypothetical protein
VIPKRRLVWLDILCVAGTLWCAVLCLLLLAGVHPLPTAVAVIVAAALVLPGFIAGVITNRVTFRANRPRTLGIATVWAPPNLPRPAVITAAALLVGFVAIALSALIRFDGTAGVRDGAYVLTDSTGTRPVTRAAYETQLAVEQQVGLGVMGALGVGGTVLAAASAAGRRPRVPLQ